MRKRHFIVIVSLLLLLLVALFFYPKKSTPAITFFPLDKEDKFQHATNLLKLHQKDKSDAYSISWKSSSESHERLYLRQDVSVLYKDGKLIGVKSIWKEDAKKIDLSDSFEFKKDHFFQAVFLHYGEKHYPENRIKSLQQMSYSELFIIGRKEKGFTMFEQPKNNHDSPGKMELKQETNENLLHHWHKLTSHFNIDLAQYEVVPLTELHQFEEKALLSFTEEQTDEIVAKLWEGLYKNYVIPIANKKSETEDSHVPLILFGKYEHDILVLFELNGEKIKLIQRYPTF